MEDAATTLGIYDARGILVHATIDSERNIVKKISLELNHDRRALLEELTARRTQNLPVSERLYTDRIAYEILRMLYEGDTPTVDSVVDYIMANLDDWMPVSKREHWVNVTERVVIALGSSNLRQAYELERNSTG